MNDPMLPEARESLRRTIRGGSGRDGGLRRRLLDGLAESLEATYQLGIKRRGDTSLDAGAYLRRQRLEDWERAQPAPERARGELIEQAASTLLNRLVVLRILEAQGLRRPVLSGGREGVGLRAFLEVAPELRRDDDTEGYAFLLSLVFEDLAQELPGLFGPVGMTALVPLPARVLFDAVTALNDPALDTCWGDDTCLGWVYQYWNDPAREALDAKLNAREKLQPHEIASKTQMFTERYMVDWLLQNSLNQMWLATCDKQGWTPECRADGTLDRLEARRVSWRAKREAEEVSLTELMPLHSPQEQRWAYWVPQPMPADAVTHAPDSLRGLKLLDPACGSGHFLVIALDLLVALHQEEDRHRGETRSLRQIVSNVLEDNLYGIDLDPRAVQIAAAALWLKARALLAAVGDTAPLQVRKLNLVASQLGLGRLEKDHPARRRLREAVQDELGVPGAVTDQLLESVAEADHLGSLLKVGDAALRAVQRGASLLESAEATPGEDREASAAAAAERLLAAVEGFLSHHTRSDDLGLRLSGEQLAAGVRFLRMVKEGQYDLVVGNPPYQGTSKMADAEYVKVNYPEGKADLYAAFLMRGLELVRKGGVSGLLTMRNWMFIGQFGQMRRDLTTSHGIRSICDLGCGAFDEIPAAQVVVDVAISIIQRDLGHSADAISVRPYSEASVTQVGEQLRKRAALRCGLGCDHFSFSAFEQIPDSPFLYWVSADLLSPFNQYPLLGEVETIAPGLKTGDDTRFLRAASEVQVDDISSLAFSPKPWRYYVKGASGERWYEPARTLIRWNPSALELEVYGYYCAPSTVRIREKSIYFSGGVAFSMIGYDFGARLHRFPSVFGNKGTSILTSSCASVLCRLNSSYSTTVMKSLNPSISFEARDVARVPFWPVPNAEAIVECVAAAFTTHESHREPSVEFLHPGPSAWDYAQAWAQRAVDRPEGAPLPDWDPVFVDEPATDHLSYALGVALGRFKPDGTGLIDPNTDELSHALPDGLLFLSAFSPDDDGLSHEACALLRQTWEARGADIDPKRGLHELLRARFFDAVHRGMYDNKPIHWPLSSSDKSFVAWVTIHRMNGGTLRALLARHLGPERERLQARLDSLRAQRNSSEGKAKRDAEAALEPLQRLNDELVDFIDLVKQCAEKGPPPTGPKCPAREVDAPYDPVLDDGVMINSAALWPLLEPQWKKPKEWWTELAKASGRKDYDWSQLAGRYFPTRVDKKCRKDPSLGVAHGCFWRYHPERAWSWELRLGLEIEAGFTVDEDGSDGARLAFLDGQAKQALKALEDEVARRHRKDKELTALTVELPVAGVWERLGGELVKLEKRLSVKKGVEKVVSFPEPDGGREAWLAARPKVKAGLERVLRGVGGQQVSLL